MWDAYESLKFADDRSRPFFDLLARVRRERTGLIADLGCGPGNLTRSLAERWPDARVIGIDSSPEMLTQARRLTIPGGLDFVAADISSWQPDQPPDLIVSNAALQWVSNHAVLLLRITKALAPGGTLAVQMPYHFDSPAHQAIEQTKADPRWREQLQGIGLHRRSVMPLVWYVERLHDLGFSVDAWETIYLHVLTGADPVLEWFKGSALRPLLACLPSEAGQEFLGELAGRLRQAFPPRHGVTLLPFTRLFFVATRPL